MIRPTLLISLVLLGACRVADTEPTAPQRPQTQKQALIVHEWGTYTSLQSSLGRTMSGLHHAEELLPSFVHARDPENPDHKGLGDVPVAPAVTQKLETPVIYFYGDASKVDVTVQFPRGLITEWFPEAAEMSPPIGGAAAMAGGSMRWSVELIDRPRGPFVPEDSVWAPSRRVASRGVRAAGVEEQFIFYRGLGAFERPVFVEPGLTSLPSIPIRNASSEDLPAAFLLSVDESGGAVVNLGKIAAGETARAELPQAKEPLENYPVEARAALARALEESGLYADEARAMVDTWNHSYFLNPGTRVLYIAPRSWADELLPIQITPAPKELVRTLVGRIEVLLPEEEQRIVRDLHDAAEGKITLQPDAYGRFTEPKLRRALELISDPRVRAYAERLVDQAALLP